MWLKSRGDLNARLEGSSHVIKEIGAWSESRGDLNAICDRSCHISKETGTWSKSRRDLLLVARDYVTSADKLARGQNLAETQRLSREILQVSIEISTSSKSHGDLNAHLEISWHISKEIGKSSKSRGDLIARRERSCHVSSQISTWSKSSCDLNAHR